MKRDSVNGNRQENDRRKIPSTVGFESTHLRPAKASCALYDYAITATYGRSVAMNTKKEQMLNVSFSSIVLVLLLR